MIKPILIGASLMYALIAVVANMEARPERNDKAYPDTSERLVVQVPVVIRQDSELDCMAITIYREARNQPVEAQYAVGQTILNRVMSQHYRNTICEVIMEPHQFAGSSPSDPNYGPAYDLFMTRLGNDKDLKAMDLAYTVAVRVRRNDPILPTSILHFHSGSKPHWAEGKEATVVIDGLNFYGNI